MNELDVAMLFIFDLGMFGLRYEPWSPHPLPMVIIGGLYLCVRITAYILVRIHRRFKKRR